VLPNTTCPGACPKPYHPMENTDLEEALKKALNGDIRAFQTLFLAFSDPLKSYLYRLLANRQDVDDLAQDTFVRAFEKLGTFTGGSSLKTWVFSIATNLAYELLRKRKRWLPSAQDRAKELATNSPLIQEAFYYTHQNSPYGRYDVQEHIDFCFTCMGKTLPIDQQVAVILKDVYGFSRKEIMHIMGLSEGVVKHLLHDGRKLLAHVFNQRCALINKQGACHQCTELAGIYNPKQAKREALMQLDLVKQAEKQASQETLYELRAKLVAQIDPMKSPGADLQDIIMQCTRQAVGETEGLFG